MGGGGGVWVTLGNDQVALGVLGVGVAGRQGQQIPSRLYQYRIYVVRLYNFQFTHAVGQGLPRRGQGDFVADLYLLHVAQHLRAVVAAVGGNDRVGVRAAQRHRGLPQQCAAPGHVFGAGPQIHRQI